VGYSESEVETYTAALELETDITTLELETEMNMSQEISKNDWYSAD
jgi:predicted transcriptional regulator